MMRSGHTVTVLLTAFCVLFGALPLAADTVLVHVHGDTSALSRDAAVTPGTTAFEDGLMIPLFEHGHIVFNLVDDGEPLDVDTARVVGLAEGVDWVVLVQLHFVPTNGAARIDRASYAIVQVSEAQDALQGNFARDVFEPRRGETATAAIERVGRLLAGTMLNEI